MTEENKIEVYTTGSMWEEGEWHIRIDSKIVRESDTEICKHCHSFEIVEERSYVDDSVFYREFFTCPYVVIGLNEGGHNSTGICLECIMEAAKELLKEE